MRAENALRWVAFGCAIFLVFAMVMPDWLAASAAFAYGAYAAGDYWLGLTRGVALLDGHARMGSKWTIHRPDALPVFFVAALIGAVASFALAVSWPRQAHGDHAG